MLSPDWYRTQLAQHKKSCIREIELRASFANISVMLCIKRSQAAIVMWAKCTFDKSVVSKLPYSCSCQGGGVSVHGKLSSFDRIVRLESHLR